MLAWSIDTSGIGYLTSAVQFGFICGTLTISVSGIADRFSATRIFAIAAFGGACFNVALAFVANDFYSAMALRFLTGMMLAGIYPIGMKLVVSWAPDKSGQALGLLVGMLTLGTASPQLLNAWSVNYHWSWVLIGSSTLALLAALFILLLGDGPHLPKARKISGNTLQVFQLTRFRAAAFAYFGHMWELYAFWMLVPLLVLEMHGHSQANTLSLLAFTVIAIGAVGCVLGGILSKRYGNARIAATALGISGLLCCLYPLSGDWPYTVRLTLLLLWGFTVVADSPQFSALSAKACPPEKVGSALAIQNSIGFFITIISITLISHTFEDLGLYACWILAPGPILGLIALRNIKHRVD